MGLHGCSATGELDDQKFSEPMPWIGLYIVGASLVCSLAMGIDTFYAFRRRKIWFPCKFFSLNATSLTLLSIATKLPVDLNTSMPSREDQLTKLSSTILICTAMGNFMTSLGTMEASELLSNVVALAILVITVIVNVGIQMGTGVIYAFVPEHAIVMFFMMILLVILVFSALTVPTAQQLLERQYLAKQVPVMNRVYNDDVFEVDKLKEAVQKGWMVAHTCSPQYVRSATCTTAGDFCLLSALILLEASVRSFISSSLDFCRGESDYKWSIKLVLISQVIAVVVGTIPPAIRWFNAISFTSPSQKRSYRDVFKVEGYWIQRLVDWKESPLPFHIGRRQCRKIVYFLKFRFLDACIGLQTAVVVFCKFVSLASILPLSLLSRVFCRSRKGHYRDSESNQPESKNLQDFVLHLEGEDVWVDLIMKSGLQDMKQLIEKSRKNEPTHLIKLLESALSESLNGVAEFDGDQVPPIGEKLQNCWVLPVVTLTSIAVAIPDIDQNTIRSLRDAVDEGLKYVRLIESCDTDIYDLKRFNMRKAADIVWRGIDIYDQWLDIDLHILVTEEKHTKKIIEKLMDIGSKSVLEFTAGGGGEWPAKVLAANSMYWIGKTILEKHNDKLESPEDLSKWLQTTIADILGACLTNLPRVISIERRGDSIDEREKEIKDAASALGEVQDVFAILSKHKLPDLSPYEMADIDDWREALSRPSSPDDV
ncbi:uncharacterized protein LOC131248310 [Magnolia sinica]|uniref:uncharacterized protein LOC131248310 n=1 Tax=Magnolia sinica TaxID=86752 RepID=UPI00265AD8C7|nr:uncharacterized protein LOC131248310 [Magnolia sinica]